MRKFTLLPALVLAASLTACDPAVDPLAPSDTAFNNVATENQELGYAIRLLEDPAYDSRTDRTTFVYTVTSGTKPAISHWVLGIGARPESFSATGVPHSTDASQQSSVTEKLEWMSAKNPDHSTGAVGLKFDTGYQDGQTRTVTLVLAGRWVAGEVVATVKAGDYFRRSAVRGPVAAGATAPATHAISGIVYFDANANRMYDQGEEPGIPGIRLSVGGRDALSAGNGSFSVSGFEAGDYRVAHLGLDGLLASTPASVDGQVSGGGAVVHFGLRLDLAALAGRTANGYTIGYWKNNVNKAIAGTTRGVQVSKASLLGYLGALHGFAIDPFSDVTSADPTGLRAAAAYLGARGSDPAVLLRKQLLAAELNYASGAYLGGSELLTRLFLWQGEHMAKHSASYGAADLLRIKDWYDAYNNTHGGPLIAPAG